MTNPFRIAGGEFDRFKGLLPKLALIFVTAVPLMYGAIYLAANWDPYGKLDQLPVAVVNQDQPAKAEGRTITAGDDFVSDLKSDGEFDWHEVDSDAAGQGLSEGDYYLVVSVPSDFSRNLVSGQTDDPVRANIEVRRDDANGFVIGSITGQAQTEIEQAVDRSAVESYFDVVFENLATIKSGLDRAAGGAGKLDRGLVQAHDGSGQLAQGSSTLASGAHELSSGASSLASGLGVASDGAAGLSSGLGTLDTKSEQLATGADQVADGTQQLRDTVVPPIDQLQQDLPQIRQDASQAGDALTTIADTAAGDSESLSATLNQLENSLNCPQSQDPACAMVDRAQQDADTIHGVAVDNQAGVRNLDDRVQSALDQLGKAAGSAKQKVDQLNDGAHQVATGNHDLHTAIGSAATGARSLADGVSTASDGADELDDGATDLAGGADELKSGSRDLDQALGQLSRGAGTLHDQLATSAKKVPAVNEDQQADAAQVLSAPARVDMTVDHPATYYGRGLAPMFFAIALWVFGITAFLILRPFSGRSLLGRGNLVARHLGNWLPAGLLAMAGGLLTIGTVWFLLGLDPVRPLTLIGITLLGAIAFSSIAHTLRMALGTPGSAILLLWLILQLAATGGTYPAAVLPRFFAEINPYMPMTYLIDAYRIAISGGETAHLIRDVLILGGTLILALIVGLAVAWWKQRISVRDLHPELEPA